VLPGMLSFPVPAATLTEAKRRSTAIGPVYGETSLSNPAGRPVNKPIPSTAMSTHKAAAATRILIVRHGQSEWNAAGRWQGRADPPLTFEGRRQASVAARALGPFDAVVSSPLQRAGETASIIAEYLGTGTVLTDTDLMERDAGEWQGLTRNEIELEWPGYLEEGKRPPSYESNEAMVGRVIGALSRIAERAQGGNVLVVAHGGVVYALEESCGEQWRRIPNLGARWFQVSDGMVTAGQRIELLPDGTLPDLL